MRCICRWCCCFCSSLRFACSCWCCSKACWRRVASAWTCCSWASLARSCSTDECRTFSWKSACSERRASVCWRSKSSSWQKPSFRSCTAEEASALAESLSSNSRTESICSPRRLSTWSRCVRDRFSLLKSSKLARCSRTEAFCSAISCSMPSGLSATCSLSSATCSRKRSVSSSCLVLRSFLAVKPVSVSSTTRSAVVFCLCNFSTSAVHF
mmetsp:Transcript_33346/g.84932  ORF Transcript_33346/g.84932 Transcript_33346/m.84932 type:complete len:211 (-) Transcript_33346:690-1322(-)